VTGDRPEAARVPRNGREAITGCRAKERAAAVIGDAPNGGHLPPARKNHATIANDRTDRNAGTAGAEQLTSGKGRLGLSGDTAIGRRDDFAAVRHRDTGPWRWAANPAEEVITGGVNRVHRPVHPIGGADHVPEGIDGAADCRPRAAAYGAKVVWVMGGLSCPGQTAIRTRVDRPVLDKSAEGLRRPHEEAGRCARAAHAKYRVGVDVRDVLRDAVIDDQHGAVLAHRHTVRRARTADAEEILTRRRRDSRPVDASIAGCNDGAAEPNRRALSRAGATDSPQTRRRPGGGRIPATAAIRRRQHRAGVAGREADLFAGTTDRVEWRGDSRTRAEPGCPTI